MYRPRIITTMASPSRLETAKLSRKAPQKITAGTTEPAWHPIIKELSQLLSPPGKDAESVKALRNIVGGVYFPEYHQRSHYPGLLPWRKYFTEDENTIGDALYHNYIFRLPVNMNQAVCGTLRLLGQRRQKIKKLNEELIEARTVAADNASARALRKKDISYGEASYKFKEPAAASEYRKIKIILKGHLHLSDEVPLYKGDVQSNYYKQHGCSLEQNSGRNCTGCSSRKY